VFVPQVQANNPVPQRMYCSDTNFIAAADCERQAMAFMRAISMKNHIGG
jgi:hypothetical protein